MFGSSARFLVPQLDSEQRKMQTDATCCQALSLLKSNDKSFDKSIDKSSDRLIDKSTQKSNYKSTAESSYDVDDRLANSSTFGRFSSRSGELGQSDTMSFLQSTSEQPAVNSDKVSCESQRSMPSNCNVTSGDHCSLSSPSRPADSNSNCSTNCKNLSTMDSTSRTKLSETCSCVRHANCCVQNQSSFKPCANRSSAIHVDQTHPSDCPTVGHLNSSKDDKSPASLRRSSSKSSKSSISPIKSSSKSSSNRSSSIEPSSSCSLISHLSSFSRSSLSFTRNHQSLLVPLLLVLCTVIRMSDACSARSTPKPRPPLPEIRPNITFQTYQCPEAYAKWYCLNGATCFFVRIGESILYNCECADGYMGQRCEFKDLEGSYLQSREKVLVETAKVAGGAFTVLVLLAFVALIFFANYKKRKSGPPINEHRPPSINFIA